MAWSEQEKEFLVREYKESTFKQIAEAINKKESTVRVMAKRLGLSKNGNIEADKKKCSKCEFIYPANTDFFPKDNSKKDGLHNHCKDCHREYRYKKKQGVKKCNNCECIKSKLDFQVRKNNKDGLDNICKTCRSVKARKYLRKSKPKGTPEEERKRLEKYMEKYGHIYNE